MCKGVAAMPAETSDQAQADTLAKAMLLMLEKSAEYRKKVEVLELECKALALENARLRAKMQRYEVGEIERRLADGVG